MDSEWRDRKEGKDEEEEVGLDWECGSVGVGMVGERWGIEGGNE